MNCNIIHKKLIFFLEGDLPREHMEKVAEHLNQCGDCAAFAEDLRKTMGIVQMEKQVQVSPYFYTRLKARIIKEQDNQAAESGSIVWKRVLQPALFTVLLVVGILAGVFTGRQAGRGTVSSSVNSAENIVFLNEMEAEPLETFLME